MKMNRKTTLLVVFVLMIFIVGTLGFICLEETPEPENFVKNKSLEHDEGIFFVKDIVRYPAKGNVTPLMRENRSIRLGIAAETYELNFGSIPQNLTVRKLINLRNNEDVPVKVCVLCYGGIKPLITVDKNNLILKKDEAKEIEIRFNATNIGSYTGEVDVVIKKPKYDPLAYLLPWVRC